MAALEAPDRRIHTRLQWGIFVTAAFLMLVVVPVSNSLPEGSPLHLPDFLIPLFGKLVSRKSLLAVGIVAYALRMVLFAYTDSMLAILLGVSLHGLCFGCFIFVAFMIVDEETTDDVRASAQNMFNLVIVGIGIIVGSYFALNIVGEWATIDKVTDYTRLFSVPMWIAFGCLALLFLFYPGGRRPAAQLESSGATS